MRPQGSVPGDSAVELVGVEKDYGAGSVLGGITLSVPKGASVALIGPNGSGKSTLLRIVAGLSEATAGQVRILGAKAGSLEARSVTSYAGDDPVLYDDLSVIEHLEYLGRLNGVADWEPRARELMDRLGLADRADQLPGRLSRGLRQKVALAVALIRPFALLLVDEPFIGLDKRGRQALRELFSEAAEAGRTVVVATHQLDYLEGVDRCIGILDGEVMMDGPPKADEIGRLLDG